MTEGRDHETERLWVSPEDLRRQPEIARRRAGEFIDPPPISALGERTEADTVPDVERTGRDEPCPDGASGATTRRDFTKLLGLGLAAAGCSRAPVREAVPFVDKPEEMTPGAALRYATTCAGCDAACPVVVKTRDGRPIKVEGNRLASSTGGGTCAVGQATVLSLYDDRRFPGALWRGEAVSWSELDERVRRHLAAAHSAGGRVAVVTGSVVSPTSRALLEDFVARHDARWVSWDPVSEAAVRDAHEACFGVPVVPSYRLDRARAVLGLEADFLATGSAPVEHLHGYSRARRLPEMAWHGQFESRLSPTGANADLRAPVEASEVGTVAAALLARLERRTGRTGAARTAGRGPKADLAPEPDLAPKGVPEEVLEQTAEMLWRHRGASLVICGVADPAVQQVVCALNDLLGNHGETLDLERPSYRRQGDERALDELIEEMRRGEIHVLFLWGVNPAYHHPRSRDFLDGLERVALSVSFAGRPDETTVHVDAVAPNHHFLEAWGDAEPVPGRLSLAQPTLAPLLDTRAAQAGLLAWMGKEPDWRGYLEERWRREVFPRQRRVAGLESLEDFETFWHRTLHDGILELPERGDEGGKVGRLPSGSGPDVGAAIRQIAVRTAAARQEREAGGLEVVLYEKVGPRDGRWAHVPWLQELPDPVSRVTWGNYAALAPATAERLGLEEGDEVRLEVEGTAVELPVAIQPGQAPATVAVALGYGRREAGPVADGVGADAFPLVDTSQDLFRYHRIGASLTATGRRRPLAATQTHHLLEDRPHVHETTLAAWSHDPASGHPGGGAGHGGNGGGPNGHGSNGHGSNGDGSNGDGSNGDGSNGASHGGSHEGSGGGHGGLPNLWQDRPEIGHSWGMAVDLNACTGCGACVVACQAENNVPVVGPDEVRRGREMHWLRIDRYYRGSAENPDTVFQPMMCQHCDHAPCETVCPVLATVHSADGLNQQVYNRCVGTRYCANNCPYKVRRFNWFNYARNDRFDYHLNSDLGAMVLNPDVTVRSRGVMEKCSMCIQRIQQGKLTARDAGRRVRDGDILTACQQACPTEALTFGDWLDRDSRLSHLGEDPRFYRVLEELGVRPSSGYLTKVRHRDSASVAEPGEEA